MRAKVEGNPSFVRDLNNGAILNVDSLAVKRAKEAKAHRDKNKQEIEDIKSEISELKFMMQQILEKL